MSENSEKCESQFPRVQVDVFKMLVFSKTQRYLNKLPQKKKPKKLKPMHFWHFDNLWIN